ncbi:MAG: hypothetical protein JO307_21075 [Bryobacterales bacterium]|nr:hypothetical protein [Bryobacterales bacterium]
MINPQYNRIRFRRQNGNRPASQLRSSQGNSPPAAHPGGFGLFAWMFQRLETRLDGRIDKQERRFDRIEQEIKDLRRDLAEEFRAQRAEAAAQVSALANAINAARRQ